jgi:hypothetical protein
MQVQKRMGKLDPFCEGTFGSIMSGVPGLPGFLPRINHTADDRLAFEQGHQLNLLCSLAKPELNILPNKFQINPVIEQASLIF